MGLMKPDLYRNFGIGFLVGGLFVVAAASDSGTGDFAAPAQAAEIEVFEPVEPTSEFIITVE
ncbi:MAG: hypothetical protein ABJP48_04565 [Erythrobacter sp.]